MGLGHFASDSRPGALLLRMAVLVALEHCCKVTNLPMPGPKVFQEKAIAEWFAQVPDQVVIDAFTASVAAVAETVPFLNTAKIVGEVHFKVLTLKNEKMETSKWFKHGGVVQDVPYDSLLGSSSAHLFTGEEATAVMKSNCFKEGRDVFDRNQWKSATVLLTGNEFLYWSRLGYRLVSLLTKVSNLRGKKVQRERMRQLSRNFNKNKENTVNTHPPSKKRKLAPKPVVQEVSSAGSSPSCFNATVPPPPVADEEQPLPRLKKKEYDALAFKAKMQYLNLIVKANEKGEPVPRYGLPVGQFSVDKSEYLAKGFSPLDPNDRAEGVFLIPTHDIPAGTFLMEFGDWVAPDWMVPACDDACNDGRVIAGKASSTDEVLHWGCLKCHDRMVITPACESHRKSLRYAIDGDSDTCLSFKANHNSANPNMASAYLDLPLGIPAPFFFSLREYKAGSRIELTYDYNLVAAVAISHDSKKMQSKK